jgi:hypothetical protein
MSDLVPKPGASNSNEPVPDAAMTPEDETVNVMSGEALKMYVGSGITQSGETCGTKQAR